ncbi:hypothetical protein KAZ57_01510 [Patescibacteria group bacterium]|nr:hypothetical protein [Patescibacteria group bacterium]
MYACAFKDGLELFHYISGLTSVHPWNILQIVDIKFPEIWFLVFTDTPGDIQELIEKVQLLSTTPPNWEYLEERINQICLKYLQDTPIEIDHERLVWVMQNGKVTKHLAKVPELVGRLTQMGYDNMMERLST